MRMHRTLVLGASLLMAFSTAAVGEASSAITPIRRRRHPAPALRTRRGRSHQDRRERLLGVRRHGRALRPGPGGGRPDRRAQAGHRAPGCDLGRACRPARTSTSCPSTSAASSRRSRARRTRPPPTPPRPRAAPGGAAGAAGLQRAGPTRPAWTRTRSWSPRTRPPSTRSPASSDLAKVAGELELGPAARVRHHAAVLRRAAQVRHRHRQAQRHRARCVRRRDGHGDRERRRPGGRAVLDPGGHRPERTWSSSRTTWPPSLPTTSRPWSATTCCGRSRPRASTSRPSSIPSRRPSPPSDLTALQPAGRRQPRGRGRRRQGVPDLEGPAAGRPPRHPLARHPLLALARRAVAIGGRPV